MRILLLTQYYPPEIGGAQNRLSSLATSLGEAGHTVTVLTALPNYPTGAIYEGYKNGLEVAAKIAKARWQIYEVPISYCGRTYAEGKKITWRDGVKGLYCTVKYNVSPK